MKKMPAGRLEPLDIEAAVRSLELHQVDARQVAGRVVEEHVLGARVRGVDRPRVRAGVPAVDRRVVLHARIAAVPGPLGDLPQEVTWPSCSGPAVLGSVTQWVVHCLPSTTACMNSSRDADREIRVLEHDRAVGLAVEVRVVSPLSISVRAFFSSLRFGTR